MTPDLVVLAQALTALGCPPEKTADMAAQLDKRARQLAETKGRSYEQAMQHLLGLMRQGWAAQPAPLNLAGSADVLVRQQTISVSSGQDAARAGN
jgi:hypothetical protein